MDACNKIYRHSDIITLHTSRFIMKGTGKWVSFSKELKIVDAIRLRLWKGQRYHFHSKVREKFGAIRSSLEKWCHTCCQSYKYIWL